MNCSPNVSTKIAEEALAAMSGQLDQMHNLALAALGATIALLVQVAVHNTKEPSRPLNLNALRWIFASTLLQIVSVLFGILAKGSLTASIPAILTADFCVATAINSTAYPGARQATVLAALQSCAFFLGIASIGWSLWRNRQVIHERSEK